MKVIIFDFDDTLYNGNVWGDWDNYINSFLDKYFETRMEKQKFLDKFISNSGYLDERCICRGLIQENGTSKPMIDYLIQNPYDYHGDNVKFISNNFLEELSKKYNLYIVSNTPNNTIKIAFKKYGIDSNVFKDILFNALDTLNASKKDKYKKIMQLENVKAGDVVVVGDSFSSDIEPAIQLGMKYLHVKSINDIYNYNF